MLLIILYIISRNLFHIVYILTTIKMGGFYLHVATFMLMISMKSTQAARDCKLRQFKDTYKCDGCALHGADYTIVLLSQAGCQPSEIKWMYNTIDSLGSKRGYFDFELENPQVTTLRAALFGSNMKVLDVNIKMRRLSSLQSNVFEHQDLIRKVIIEKSSITVSPPPALLKLKNLVVFSLKSFGERMQVNSFNRIVNPSTISNVSISIYNKPIAVRNNAFSTLTNMMKLEITGQIVCMKTVVNALPKNMTNLRKIDVSHCGLTKFPTSLFKKISTSNAAANLEVHLQYNKIQNMSETDWKLVSNFHTQLRANLIDCSTNCHMIRMAIKYNKRGNVREPWCLRPYYYISALAGNSRRRGRLPSKPEMIQTLKRCGIQANKKTLSQM